MNGAQHFQQILEQAQQFTQGMPEDMHLQIVAGVLGGAALQRAAALIRSNDFASASDLIEMSCDAMVSMGAMTMSDPAFAKRTSAAIEQAAAALLAADGGTNADRHTIESPHNIELPVETIGTPEEIEHAKNTLALMNVAPMPNRVHIRTIGKCFFDENCEEPVTHNPIFIPGPEDGPGDFHTIKIDDCCTYHAAVLASLCLRHTQNKEPRPPKEQPTSNGRLTQQELDDLIRAQGGG